MLRCLEHPTRELKIKYLMNYVFGLISKIVFKVRIIGISLKGFKVDFISQDCFDSSFWYIYDGDEEYKIFFILLKSVQTNFPNSFLLYIKSVYLSVRKIVEEKTGWSFNHQIKEISGRRRKTKASAVASAAAYSVGAGRIRYTFRWKLGLIFCGKLKLKMPYFIENY